MPINSVYSTFILYFSNQHHRSPAIFARGRTDLWHMVRTLMFMTTFRVAHASSAISHIAILDLPREKQL